MTTMVEKMALALLNADRTRNGWPEIVNFRLLSELDADTYRSSARAALTALLEPSEGMVRAGEVPTDDFHRGLYEFGDAFQNAIQAALDEREG